MYSNLPSVQRAWRVVRRGLPTNALMLDDNTPIPKVIPAGSVLVRIKACTVDPASPAILQRFPVSLTKSKRIPEFDFAGQVVNSNGSCFNDGDEVFGLFLPMDNFRDGQGALASYALVPASNIALRPPNLSAIEASGLAGPGLTAYHALFGIAQMESGQTIFIHGGNTNMGIFAIQLAKSRGCTIYTSAPDNDEKFLRALGADEFINETAAPVHLQLLNNPPSPRFHAILDAIGITDTALYTSCESYLAPRGIFVSVGPEPDTFSSAMKSVWELCLRPRWAGGTNREFRWFILAMEKTELREFRNLVAEGIVRPVVDSVHQFEDALQAYEKLLQGPTRGSVVIET